MAQSVLTEMSYRLYVAAPSELKESVQELRRYFSAKYGIAPGYPLQGVLIARFDSMVAWQAPLLRAICQAAERQDGFLLRFDGIRNVPSHSFLLASASKPHLAGLSKNVSSIRSAMRSQSSKPFFPDEYDLVLFNRLASATYDKVVHEINDTHIQLQCMATHLLLMQKEQVPGAVWKHTGDFILKKRTHPEQASLF